MKPLLESGIVTILLVSLFLSCQCTPIPQTNGLVPRHEPLSFPMATSTPLSTQDDSKILSRHGEDHEEAPNPPPNERTPLVSVRPQPRPGAGPSRHRIREPELHRNEQKKAKALLQPVKSGCTNQQLPWNKEPGEEGSWTDDEIKTVIVYVYFMQRSATKRGTPNAMQEPVTVSTFRKEKEGLKSITERKELSAKMNQMWSWVKERRNRLYTLRKEVRVMNRSGDVEKVANLIRRVEEGKEPWKKTTPETDRWDTKTLKMVLANMLERTGQDLNGKTGYAFVKDKPYVSLERWMDTVWPLHDKYLKDLELLTKKSGTRDSSDTMAMDIDEDVN